MDNFIGNHVKFFAEWGQLITSGVFLTCLFLVYLLVRNNKYYLPNGVVSGLGVFLLFLIMLASSLVFARITQVKPGVMAIINQLEHLKEKAMPLSFRMVTDSSFHEIEEFRGKVVLLNFWATWCKPCLTEIPDLNQLQVDYKEKGLEVILISDEKQDRLLRFHDKNSMQINSGFVESFDWAAMGSERPVTFLINRDGIIVDYFTGAYDYPYFESQILKLLKE